MDSSRLDAPAGISTTEGATQVEPEAVAESIPREQLLEVSRRVEGGDAPSARSTELVLMDVDPRRVHAYWSVDDASLRDATERAGARAQLVLRMCDVTDGSAPVARGARTFDVDVQGTQNQWDIDLWQPGRAYVATLGLLNAEGALVPIVSSNEIRTPQPFQSGNYDTAAVATNLRREDGQVVVTDLAAQAGADTERPQSTELTQSAAIPTADMLAASLSNVHLVDPWSAIAHEAVREVAPQPGAAVIEADTVVTAERVALPPAWPGVDELAAGATASVGDVVSQASVAVSASSEPATFEQAVASLEALPGDEYPRQFADFTVQAKAIAMGGVDDRPTDAGELAAAADVQVEGAATAQEQPAWPSAEQLSIAMPSAEPLDPGAAQLFQPTREGVGGADTTNYGQGAGIGGFGGGESLPAGAPPAAGGASAGVESKGAPGLMPPLPLENYVQLSSFELGTQNVWLEVHTELLIHGRAKPGTELLLYGQKVQVRPDGTFSIRRPLPQGALVLPLLFSGTVGI